MTLLPFIFLPLTACPSPYLSVLPPCLSLPLYLSCFCSFSVALFLTAISSSDDLTMAVLFLKEHLLVQLFCSCSRTHSHAKSHKIQLKWLLCWSMKSHSAVGCWFLPPSHLTSHCVGRVFFSLPFGLNIAMQIFSSLLETGAGCDFLFNFFFFVRREERNSRF